MTATTKTIGANRRAESNVSGNWDKLRDPAAFAALSEAEKWEIVRWMVEWLARAELARRNIRLND